MSFDDKGMIEVPIRNKEVLAILDKFRRIKDEEGFEESMHAVCDAQKDQREYWCSKEYLKKVMDQKKGHDGFPEVCYAYDFKIRDPLRTSFSRDASTKWRTDVTRKLGELNEELQSIVSGRFNALCSVYPPGGFISWHNNANAHAYNIIFSWSETGDSFWEHVDPKTGEVVHIPDPAGEWTCKAGYFGHYGEPEHLLYHKAETNCWRMTVSYMYTVDEGSRFMRESALEEIMSE